MGEIIKIVRYVPGDVRVVDGKRVGIEWFSVVDRIDVYVITRIERIIKPDFNHSTKIEIKIIVALVSEEKP